MIDLILIGILIAGFSVWFAEVGIMPVVKYWLKAGRLKPFDCPMCLSWWLGLLVFAFNLLPIHSATLADIIAAAVLIISLAACTSLLAVFISKIIKP